MRPMWAATNPGNTCVFLTHHAPPLRSARLRVTIYSYVLVPVTVVTVTKLHPGTLSNPGYTHGPKDSRLTLSCSSRQVRRVRFKSLRGQRDRGFVQPRETRGTRFELPRPHEAGHETQRRASRHHRGPGNLRRHRGRRGADVRTRGFLAADAELPAVLRNSLLVV